MTPERRAILRIRAKAKAIYNEGSSLAAVASELGVSEETARRILIEAGATIRRGRPRLSNGGQ